MVLELDSRFCWGILLVVFKLLFMRWLAVALMRTKSNGKKAKNNGNRLGRFVLRTLLRPLGERCAPRTRFRSRCIGPAIGEHIPGAEARFCGEVQMPGLKSGPIPEATAKARATAGRWTQLLTMKPKST